MQAETDWQIEHSASLFRIVQLQPTPFDDIIPIYGSKHEILVLTAFAQKPPLNAHILRFREG